MSCGGEKRSEGRLRASSLVRVCREDGGRLSGRFELLDISGRGIAFKGPGLFPPGTRLWFELPDYNLCVAGEVRHSWRSWFSGRTGVRFIAPPCCLD